MSRDAKLMNETQLKGTVYAGRAAGGINFGGEVLLIAPDDKILAKAWKALTDAKLDTSMVYDVRVIGEGNFAAVFPSQYSHGEKP